MPLKFGLSLPQGWTMELAHMKDPVEAYETMTQVAQVAEEGGFESLWLGDHFHTFPQPSQAMVFECWTTAAAIARDTSRIRIGQMVTCNGYRNPALLAKMASTVDVISHGRLDLGIGAGVSEHEHRAYGYDYPETPDRLRQLREAVQVILAMWMQEEAVFEGKYYQVRGAINQPKGVQKPHIPLLIGGGGEHVTLKLVAQYGDACNVSGSLETIQHKFDALKKHCETVGRDYECIRRTVTLSCIIGETDEQAEAKVPASLPGRAAILASALIGSPATLRKRLIALEEAGVQEITLRFSDVLNLEMLRFFAREFIA
jgi:F420-dependent oxidoreductase-like protein